MNTDKQFYDQRAADLLAARAAGDIDTMAGLVAHTVIEEGPAGLGALTDAVNQAKK